MELQLQSLSAGREQFMGWVSEFRPELHRYCARMMGSAIDGEDIAETLQTTVPAVKAALVRGRARLAEAGQPAHAAPALSAGLRATLDQWVSRFNARDWDGLRALLAKDVELALVAKAQRRGAEVSQYFANYAKEDVTLTLGEVNGRVVLGVFRRGAGAPAYVIQLDVGPDGVRVIRDYRYVPYLGASLDFRPLA